MLRPTNYLNNLFCRAFILIFKREASEKAGNFFNNFITHFSGVFFASAITFVFNIWAMRALGPSEYGKTSLVLSISQLLSIFLFFGIYNSVTHYIASEKHSFSSVLGSSFLIVVLFLLIFLPIFYFLSPVFTKIFAVNRGIYLWGMIFAVFSGFQLFQQGILRGIGKFKKIAILNVISGAVFGLFVFLFLFVFKNFSYTGIVIANILRAAAFGIPAFLLIFFLIGKPSKLAGKDIFKFSFFGALNTIAGFFYLGMIDNLMINYFLGDYYVGLYSAYYIVFTLFVGKVLSVIVDVYFPQASELASINGLYSKTMSLAKKIAAPAVFIMFFAVWFLFKFYGKEYPFGSMSALLVSVSVILYSFSTLINYLVISRGVKGIRFSTFITFIAAGINVLFNYLLIPRFQIPGVILATIFATTFVFIANTLYVRKIINKIS